MRESLRRAGLVLLSIMVGLLALEIGLRASTWGYLFAWSNFVLDARTVLAERDGSRYAHDDRLGYMPRPGYAAPGIAIEADGLRHTGAVTAGPPILAVGDSFTFGHGVADKEVFSSIFCEKRGVSCLNLGRSGTDTFEQVRILQNATDKLGLEGRKIVIGL